MAVTISIAGTTLTAEGGVTVTGATTLQSTLAVTGATTLTGALTANGAVTLGNAAADAITITGTITATLWDLVTTKGDLIAASADDTVARLAAGANETRLVADSNEATGLKYVADTTNYAVAAKGDLLVGTAADTVAALTVGANDTIIIAASGEATGLKYGTVNSFTEDTAPDLGADYVVSYDTDAATHKKVLMGRAGGSVLMTEQATTSGTVKDFTIPSWATKIAVMLSGVSTGSTSNLIVQIGDSEGIEASGYIGAAAQVDVGPAEIDLSSGFILTNASPATNPVSGTLFLTLANSATFKWVASGVCAHTTGPVGIVGGYKILSAALTTVRLTSASANTFDAGTVNVRYE